VSYFQHSYLEEEEEEEEEEETEVDEEDENCHSAVDARTRAPLLAPQSAEDKVGLSAPFTSHATAHTHTHTHKPCSFCRGGSRWCWIWMRH
jgi:hypothetical protein